MNAKNYVPCAKCGKPVHRSMIRKWNDKPYHGMCAYRLMMNEMDRVRTNADRE